MDTDVFYDDGPPLAQLQAAVTALDDYVQQAVGVPLGSRAASTRPWRSAAQTPSTAPPTPVQAFGKQPFVAGQWREMARAHVAVYGLNAIGARAAEALVRAGIGKVLLVDHSCISLSDLSEMAYGPDEVGFSRTQALRLRLQSIRSDSSASATCVESFCADATHLTDRAELCKKLKVSSVGRVKRPSAASAEELGLFEALTQKRPYDAVLCCTADVEAKMHVNAICLELSLPLLDVSLSPCNFRISIHTLLPGHTCCLECVRGTQEVTPEDQVAQSLASAFPAALPHVELTAAGLLAQHSIKFLLDTGEFVPHFRMDLCTLQTESYAFPPNADCASALCIQRQEEERAHATEERRQSKLAS